MVYFLSLKIRYFLDCSPSRFDMDFSLVSKQKNVTSFLHKTDLNKLHLLSHYLLIFIIELGKKKVHSNFCLIYKDFNLNQIIGERVRERIKNEEQKIINNNNNIRDV